MHQSVLKQAAIIAWPVEQTLTFNDRTQTSKILTVQLFLFNIITSIESACFGVSYEFSIFTFCLWYNEVLKHGTVKSVGYESKISLSKSMDSGDSLLRMTMKKLLPGEWFSSMLKVHVVFNGFNMIFVAKGKWRIQSDYCVKINCFIEDKIPIQRTQKNIDSLNEDIAPENTAYCYVQRPDQTGNSFPQHDTCVFPEFQNEYEGQGMWQVVSGVKGKTQEISFQVNVQTIGKQPNRKI